MNDVLEMYLVSTVSCNPVRRKGRAFAIRCSCSYHTAFGSDCQYGMGITIQDMKYLCNRNSAQTVDKGRNVVTSKQPCNIPCCHYPVESSLHHGKRTVTIDRVAKNHSIIFIMGNAQPTNKTGRKVVQMVRKNDWNSKFNIVVKSHFV